MMNQFTFIDRFRDYPALCWGLEDLRAILITACPAFSLDSIIRNPVKSFERMCLAVEREDGMHPTPETFSPVGLGAEFSFLSPLEDVGEPFYKRTRFGYGLSYYLEGLSMLAYDLVDERFGKGASRIHLDPPFMQMIRDCDDGPQMIYELKSEDYQDFAKCQEELERQQYPFPSDYTHLRFMLMPSEVARQYCEQILMVMGMVYGKEADQKYIYEFYEPQDPKPLDWVVEGELAFCRTIVEDGWHMLVAEPMRRSRY